MIVFLDASFWGTYPAWGSFIVAFGVFILALIKSLSKKIDHVEGVVKELEKQNKTLLEQKTISAEALELDKQRFEHETKTNILEVRPVFKKIKDNRFPSQNQIQLIFKNIGTVATEIKIEGGAPIGATWSVFKHPSHEVQHDGTIDIMIQSNDPHFEGIKFDLTYYGDDDKKYTQSIEKKFGGNFQIEPPEKNNL